MAQMGSYCKAYPLPRFRAFGEWSEKADNARMEKRVVDGAEIEAPRELTDDTYLYLQENYVVTDGIFIDENIIFDAVTDEWKAYCAETLEFEVPVYETAPAAEAATPQTDGQ